MTGNYQLISALLFFFFPLHPLLTYQFVCRSVIGSPSSASLVLKQLGDVSLRAPVHPPARVCSCISRFCVCVCESECVCESVFAKLAESGFGGFERWHLHGGEPRPTARSTPLHTHTQTHAQAKVVRF